MRNFTVPFLHDFGLIGVILGGVVSVVTVNVPNASVMHIAIRRHRKRL